MAQARVIYGGPNGDRWLLVRDVRSGRVFVRHEPDAASGGETAEFGIGEFLIRGVYGPEHQELLRLIGTLVEGAPHARDRGARSGPPM